MAEPSECNNCGALLAEEDVFCGECGAPHSVPPVDEPEVVPEPGAPPGPLPAHAAGSATAGSATAGTATAGWRVSFVLLLVLGVLACLVATAIFVVFGATPSDEFTPVEDWLYSALCCLLPLGAISVVLFAAGAAIWFTRLRDR
jgi:hypothetical protein